MTCDVAVLGAGPAGANAALAAAARGLRVALIDEQSAPGGQVWRAKSAAVLETPQTPETFAGESLRAAVAESNIDHFGQTRVWQIERSGADWALFLHAGGTTDVLQTKTLIIAAGAREYVQPVPGWTTPGVIGLAGATALAKRDLIPPGQKTIVSSSGPLAFFVASEIRRLGGTVVAVVTPNSRRDWLGAVRAMTGRPDLLKRGALWIADLVAARVPIYWRHAIGSIIGDTGVTGAEVYRLDGNWAPVGRARSLAADSICLGNGLVPNVEPAQLAGVDLHHAPELGGWVPEAREDGGTQISGLFVCGDGTGIRGAAAAEIQGKLAGLGAAAYLGEDTLTAQARLRPAYDRAARFGVAMTRLSIPRAGLVDLTKDDTIMCRCESLRRVEIAEEIALGAITANAVKSGVRAGMGPCGGRYCQTAVARLIASARHVPECDVLPPTPRPPLLPVPVSAMAGALNFDDLPISKPAPL